MTDEPLQLYISGGAHITSPKRRIEEIENTVGTVETVFVEDPWGDPPSLWTRVTNFITAPLIAAGMYIWVVLLTTASTITGLGDGKIVSYLEENHDATVVRVDRNVHRLLSGGRLLWLTGHYAIVFLAVLGVPLFVSIAFEGLSVALRVGLFFALLTAGLFGLFVAGTLQTRNHVMAQEIEQFAKESSETTACLVTGSAHASGIETLLEESERVNVCSSSGDDENRASDTGAAVGGEKLREDDQNQT